MLRDLGAAVPIASVVVTALVALLGVMGYQNRRTRQLTIRSAFADVVALLADENVEIRLAGAILLRRFFDPASELGLRDAFFRRRAPYEAEARYVMAAVLRGISTGDMQKLLADGLTHAKTLEGADLQGTNLQGAYLAPKRAEGTLERADFYRADLSGASLRGARADGAQFYQARLHDTILKDAQLRKASFFEADLWGANFKGAFLDGASFQGARNIPAELRGHLDEGLVYRSPVPAPAPAERQPRGPRVFISARSARSPAQDSMYERIGEIISRDGLVVDSLSPDDYPSSSALGEIARRISGCSGVIVLGFGGIDGVDDGSGLTPWTHLEAGMAYGRGIPLLIMRQPGVCLGAFDEAVNDHRTHVVELGTSWNEQAVRTALGPWLSDVLSED